MNTMFLIELVWNREFDFRPYNSYSNKQEAIKIAKLLINSGDGARVKKIRVRNETTDKVVFNG